MKIGILQCGHLDESLKKDHGNLDHMFEILLAEQGFSFENHAVVDNEFPASVDQCDGWLVTGSVHGVYENHIWIPPLEEFIQKAYSKKIPVAGICFGHQIMAQALGGRVEKFSGGWGIGQTQYQMINDVVTSNEKTLGLMACHQDQVVELPPEARVIAKTDFCKYAGLAYNNHALSYQPHPEFTTDFMRDLIEFKISRGFDRKAGESAIARIGDQNDSTILAEQIARFYHDACRSVDKENLSEDAA